MTPEKIKEKFDFVIDSQMQAMAKRAEKARLMENWHRYAECQTYIDALDQAKINLKVVLNSIKETS